MNFVDPAGLNPLAGALTGTAIGGPVGGVIGGAIGLGIGIYAGQQIWDNWFATEGNGEGTIYVDPKGNAIPTPPEGKIEGSPDGDYIQAKDKNNCPTGVRKDGGHNPNSHSDPRAQAPHAHVPGITNPDGTPWLPVK